MSIPTRPIVKHYTMQDWLALHEVEAAKLIELLATHSYGEPQANHTPSNMPPLSAQQCWELVATALRHFWPSNSQLITTTEQYCTTHFNQPCDAPHTLDKGPDEYPQVHLYYQGTPADMLTMAHEFAHALQIVANQSRFTPPVLRELAAFIGELCFIQFLAKQQPELVNNLSAAQEHDNGHYLGTDLSALQEALQQPKTLPSSAYTYSWNYPVARLLAKQLFANLDRDSLWQIINGDWSLKQCLKANTINTPKPPPYLRLDNYLPPMSPYDKQHPAINAYRCLGIAALLDIDYWQGLAAKNIGDYLVFINHHLQDQTLLIATNQSQQPTGYITWTIDEHYHQTIKLTHQCAPFGDYLALQKQLKQHLSDNNLSVYSHHPGSAREEQLAWQN